MDPKTKELIVISAILTIIIAAVIVWKVKEYLGETTAEERKVRRQEAKKAWKDFFKTCVKWTYIIIGTSIVMACVKVLPIWSGLGIGIFVYLIGALIFKWIGADKDNEEDKK